MGIRRFLRRVAREFKPTPSQGLELQFNPFSWLLSRHPSGTPELASTEGSIVDDTLLVRRVMAAYSAAFLKFTQSNSFWDNRIFKLNKNIHDALSGTNENIAVELLRNPANNTHFWGFDAIALAPQGKMEPHHAVLANLNTSVNWKKMYAIWLYDTLMNLADAVGARRVNYPESIRDKMGLHVSPDSILDLIEEAVGARIVFPNPYPDEVGLKTRNGIASFRAIQSLYQGWRISQFAKGRNTFRVLEIGAGLGRTAYFANQLGVIDYTIVDLPLTGAAQGYFLGRTLNETQISLYGEKLHAPIKIIPASELQKIDGTFDLIVNVDSWTEMSQDTANGYWEFAKSRSQTVFSINHEANPITVRSLYSRNPSLSVTRHPYWMRRGYVEEIIRFQH